MKIPMFLKNHSVKSKLMMILMIISISSVILCLLLTTLFGAYSKVEETKKELLLNAQLLGSRNAAALAFNNVDLSNESLRILEKQSSITAGCVYNRYGKLFTTYTNMPNSSHCNPIQKDWNGFFAEGVDASLSHITVIQNIFSQGEWVGGIVLIANQQAMYHYIYGQMTMGLMVVLCIIAASFIFATYLQRFISNPISDLVLTAEMLSGSNASLVRAQFLPQEHELSRVFLAMNAIIQRAEQTTQLLSERTLDYQKALSSSRQSLKLLMKNIKNIDDSTEAVTELIGAKAIGRDVENYEQYINDIKLSVSDYKCCLEAINSITKTYENSLEENKINIAVLNVIMDKVDSLKKPKISQNLDVYIDPAIQNSAFKSVYCIRPSAWNKMNDVIFGLLSVIIGGNKEKMLLSVTYSENNMYGNLVLELQPTNDHTKNVDLENNTIEKLISSLKVSANNYKENQKEEFPDFFDEDELSKHDFDFIIDCAKYIANANDILLEINAEYPFCIIAYKIPLSSKTNVVLNTEDLALSHE